jgi:hypothetical protein
MSMLITIVFVGLVVGVLLHIRKGTRFGMFRRGTLPIPSPKADWVSTICETAALGIGGGMALAALATTFGLLGVLDQLRPAFARVAVWAAALAGAGVVLAILISLTGRSVAGILVLTAVLIGYILVVNGPERLSIRRLAPTGSTRNVNHLVLTANGWRGVDVWANGVYLGKTPVVTTMDEFFAKVPYWSGPPAGFDPEKPLENTQWIEFRFPEYVKEHTDWGGAVWDRSRKSYYLKMKLGTEWGKYGGSNSGGGGGGQYQQGYEQSWSVVFPEHEKALAKVVEEVRRMGYTVTPQWIGQVESFGQEGLNAVYRAAEKNAKMWTVLDDWARIRYGLDKVSNSTEAWAVFQGIIKEADRTMEYSTASIAGRAVDLLVPKLDPEQLAREAVRLIEGTYNYSVSHGYLGGQFYFATTVHQQFDGGLRNLPGVLAVAQAVWRLDELLDRQGKRPNIVEEQIVPAILRWHYGTDFFMQAAVALNGPVLDRFLLRQNWRTEGEAIAWSDRTFLGGSHQVNRWLYYLATVQSPAGRQFRKQYADKVLALAEATAPPNWVPELDTISFLFNDLDEGKGSLAYQFWPAYSAMAIKRGSQVLPEQWKYLVRMEPVATADMYAEAWRRCPRIDYADLGEGLRKLGPLPQKKQAQVLRAVEAAIDKDTGNLQLGGGPPARVREQAMEEIEKAWRSLKGGC